MLSKNNRKLQERKLQEKQRFGFRKYSFGLASALLGVSFMLGTGSTVSAATTTPAENVAAATTSNADSGTAEADATKSEATDTKSADAAASTTDTSATETKADTNAAEASNTASDSSATTDANSTSAATDNSDTKAENTTASDTAKTASTEPASGESKNATTDASAEKATDSAAQATNALKAAAVATDASATTTDADSTTTVTDDAASSEGKITDEGKAKGLTDSDVDPEMSDANGASLVADDSNIPSGYKADPTEGRYTFGIVSLGGDFDRWVKGDASKFKSYNGENNTHYYLRFSTSKNATNGTYDSTVYSQVVDATTDTVKWEQALTPNSGAVKVNNGTDGFELSSKVAGVTQYYELKYTDTKIGNASTSRITINPNNGSLTAVTVYSNGKAIPAGSATPGTYTSVLFPATGVIKTEYIARDAKGNETTLAKYEEGGRQGYKYTISGPREIKGYDLISSPSTTTGILGKTYNVGDVYAGGNLELSDQLQLARVYVATSEYGDAKVELRVALKKDADGNAITINSVNDSNIWKTILSTDSLAPGATASDGNYGGGASYYINGKDGIKYITDAGFTEEQLAGYKRHLTVIILANGLTQGQEPAKYYYAPQGQVRINYVTSDGKEIRGKDPVSAYENSGANTSYDVTGSTYQPQTITADGKTYRFVKSDKSMGTAGTTEINGYTYNVTPSDATGTIKSTTVNDVYYVYEQVTYHTEAESKDVTRTIEYYDSVTGEPIPSDLEKTVTQTATLTRTKIYDDQNNPIGYGTVSEDGSSYTIDDSWKVADQTWTKQDSADLSGYGYTAPDRASVDAVTVDGDTTNVTEKVYYGHQTVTVTPENPGTPGEPINPNDPNSPVYGEETDRKNLVKDASQTIHYVGAGDKTPADNVVTQKDAFTRTVTIDKVTGKVLSYTDWTGEKTFNTVDTPVVQGYHADKKTAGGLTATVDNPDVEETVTYAPNGKLVPVDPDGNPIPGADTPTYPTDPNDPTKVVPNEPIPDVPNWTPVDPSPVTPSNPGEDTPVPYTKDETPAAKYGLTEK
ncbi:mucin-binding protein, partial [Lactobacillus johnsonii]|uniref:mucin-binding protein n=1 Tax=Lactobacillus johnsonii TaxID=33959 RepID=UPI003D036ED6